MDQQILIPFHTLAIPLSVQIPTAFLTKQQSSTLTDKETGRILLEYIHGQMEWVEPNILKEALLLHTDDDL